MKTRRIIRGSLGIFALKLSIVAIILFIQACQESATPESNFDESVIENFSNYVRNGIFESEQRSVANLSSNSLSEDQASKMLEELTDKSIEFLTGLGFENSVIDTELGGKNNPNTAAIALILLESIKLSEKNTSALNVNSLFLNQAHASYRVQEIEGGDVWGCIGEAFPFAAIGYVLEYGFEEAIERYGKKGLIKVLGKAAGKTLGWIGLAIAVWEFKECMTQ